MCPLDRMYGAPVTAAKTKDLAACIQNLHLCELSWKVHIILGPISSRELIEYVAELIRYLAIMNG